MSKSKIIGVTGKPSAETRHIKKFMDGKMSPQELHQRLGIRKNCYGCGKPAVVRLRTFVALDELTKRQPEYVAQIMASNPNGPYVPTVATKYGPMVKVSDIGACALCAKEAEKAAARGPSWCIVEIDRGPDPKQAVSAQVPGEKSNVIDLSGVLGKSAEEKKS